MPIVPMLLAITSICTIAFVYFGLTAVRRYIHPAWGQHRDVTSAIFQTGGTIYAVFVAFLVVAVWQSHDAAHANIADEASLLTTLYRGSAAMEPDSGGKLRALIREYTDAVITDEWGIQARNGGASERARTAGLGMFRVFGRKTDVARQRDSGIDQIELGLLAQLQADRNRRTLQASETISSVIWLAAISNGLLVIVMSFFLFTERALPQFVMCTILATMISMLLCIIFILEQPFGGLLPLQPDAFVHSQDVYNSVDRAL